MQSSTEARHAKGELERSPAPLTSVLPDLSVAGNGTHKIHALASSMASGACRPKGRLVGSDQPTKCRRPARAEVCSGRRSRRAIGVIGAAMAETDVVGVGRLTLSRRERMVMVEPRRTGMVLITLRAAQEVRAAEFPRADGA